MPSHVYKCRKRVLSLAEASGGDQQVERGGFPREAERNQMFSPDTSRVGVRRVRGKRWVTMMRSRRRSRRWGSGFDLGNIHHSLGLLALLALIGTLSGALGQEESNSIPRNKLNFHHAKQFHENRSPRGYHLDHQSHDQDEGLSGYLPLEAADVFARARRIYQNKIGYQIDLTPDDQLADGRNSIPSAGSQPAEDGQVEETSNHVPEQLPIVVSSSDNSYVSASPISTEDLQTRSKSANNNNNNNRRLKHKHHKTHRQALGNNFTSPNRRASFLANSAGEAAEFINRQGSNSDISTTATTTERNKPFLSSNAIVQERRLLKHSSSDTKASSPTRYNSYRNKQISDTAPKTSTEPEDLPAVKDQLGNQYKVRESTIIKTRESIQAGASFINYTVVSSLHACLVECWIADSLCDTAVYQESPVDFNNHLPYNSASLAAEQHLSLSGLRDEHDDYLDEEPPRIGSDARDEAEEEDHNRLEYGEDNSIDLDAPAKKVSQSERPNFYICYLFQCAKDGRLRCQFSEHDYYTSATKSSALKSQLARELANQQLPPIKTLRPTSSLLERDKFRLGNRFQEGQASAGEFQREENYIVEAKYASVIKANQAPSLNGPQRLREPHIASIHIGQEDYKNYAASALNGSALIAILIGIAATGMLILVVGHKMNSIKRRIAYKGHRSRSLVPDKDFLISSLPT